MAWTPFGRQPPTAPTAPTRTDDASAQSASVRQHEQVPETPRSAPPIAPRRVPLTGGSDPMVVANRVQPLEVTPENNVQVVSVAQAVPVANDFKPAAGIASQSLRKLTYKTTWRVPHKFFHIDELKGLMLEVLQHNFSDLYLQPNRPPCVAVEGDLYAVGDRKLDDSEVKNLVNWVAGRDTAATDIMSGRAINAAFEVFDPRRVDQRGAKVRYRFRVNCSPIANYSSASAQIVMRSIADDPPIYDRLGLTADLVNMAIHPNGMSLIAGETGSGKSTTFASILRYILENDTQIQGSLITHEEPIEFTYENVPSAHSIIVQSQIPIHFKDFSDANREAMRRAPSLIMVGELRDESTIRAAVEAAGTGHPVFGTVHATNVAAVMRRLISRFPTEERPTAIFDIIEASRFVMAQRLIKGVDGKRLAAREYLVFNEDMREQLSNLSEMGRVTKMVRELVHECGHSFEKEAKKLLAEGLITEAAAKELSNSH